AAEHLASFALAGTQPGSSLAHDALSVAHTLLSQSGGLSAPLKHCPGPGGVCANAPPAPRKKMPPISSPRMPFMSPPPLGLSGWSPLPLHFSSAAKSPKRTGTVKGKKVEKQKKIGQRAGRRRGTKERPEKQRTCGVDATRQA